MAAARRRLALLTDNRGFRPLVVVLLVLGLVVTTAPAATADPIQPTVAAPALVCDTTPATRAALAPSTGNPSGVYAGVILTGEQVDAAATIVNVGLDQGVTRRGIVVAVGAAMAASALQSDAGTLGALGLFQQQADADTGLYTQRDRLDPIGSSRMFFDQLVAQIPWYDSDHGTNGAVADVVQHSGDTAQIETWDALAEALTAKFVPSTEPKSEQQSVVAWLMDMLKKTIPAAAPVRSAGVALSADPEATADSTTDSSSTTASTTETTAAGDLLATTDSTSAAAESSTTESDATSKESTQLETTPSESTTSTESPAPTTTTEPTTTEPTTTEPDPSTTTEPTTTAEQTPTSIPETAPTTTTEASTTTSAPSTPEPSPAPAPEPPAADDDPAVVDLPPAQPSEDDDPEFGPDTVTTPYGGAVLDCAPNNNGGSTSFDPGFIISDQVFYNSTAMNAAQIQAFLDAQGSGCVGDWCVKNLTLTTADQPADQYCNAYPGGTNETAAAVLAKVSVACGINPQVMLTTLQKESALVTKTAPGAGSYAAAWGWHCPDTGPGGSANCDPAYAGFFNQAYGMAKQWSRYRVDPAKYNYQAGETVDILWNVVESGCGGAPVTIKNTATASLYNYTPYQPNAAALQSYPGVGDRCSAYGNRNFFFLFQKYFGVTGGGAAASIAVNGVQVTVPNSPYVAAGMRGKTITAPNANVARGIAAGFASIGLPYVWGGGTNGGQADQGCSRGGGSSNSCSGTVGFDCSGLTAYVLTQAGFGIGTNSGSQRAGGASVPWSSAQAGDIIGYSGHVAIYLGVVDGVGYLLEAPSVGQFVHVRSIYLSNGGVPADSVLHRYWA